MIYKIQNREQGAAEIRLWALRQNAYVIGVKSWREARTSSFKNFLSDM